MSRRLVSFTPGRSTTEERALTTLTVSVLRSWHGRCEKGKICCPCWESNYDLCRSQSGRALKLVFNLTALTRPSTHPFCRTRLKLIPRLQTETCCRLFQMVVGGWGGGLRLDVWPWKIIYHLLFCGLLAMVFDIWTQRLYGLFPSFVLKFKTLHFGERIGRLLHVGFFRNRCDYMLVIFIVNKHGLSEISKYNVCISVRV